jgi:simple sugar transport system permease protein
MIRLEERTPPLALAVVALIIAAAAAFALAPLPLAVIGQPVLPAYATMLAGAFGSAAAANAMLAKVAPLILTGLAAALAFRVRLKNFGVEGQLLAGALTAAAVGALTHSLPAPLSAALAVVAGMLVGALMMAVPTILRVRLGTDEAIVTVLLNIVAQIGLQVVTGTPLQNIAATGTQQTLPLAMSVPIVKLSDPARIHCGLAIACLACLLAFVVVRHTVVGFEVRATGGNPVAARLAGIPVDKILLASGALSGALAGFAGAMALAGVLGDAVPAVICGLGYAGIAVALLADRAPLAVIPAALFVAILVAATESVSRVAHAPAALVDIAVAMVLITALLACMVARYRVRIIGGKAMSKARP